MQKQNGDCHWCSHTLQLGSLSNSHSCNAKLAERRRKNREVGEQWGREKCRANNFTTVWTPERSSYMCGNVCAWKSIFIWLHVNSKCLTLLELIPIKSFQRAAVCQSLTPLQQDEKEQPTNSISRTEQRRWCRADKTYNIRLAADCQARV